MRTFEGRHDAAHAVVDAFDHRGIGGVHILAAKALLVGGDLLGPGLERDVDGVVREVQEERAVGAGRA